MTKPAPEEFRRVMRNTWMPFLFVGLAVLGASALGAEHPELTAFPPAREGMERFVIVLPHKERGEDDAFRVEIILGKEMLTDGVNVVRLANTIESRPLPGWGYTYYEATGSSETLSTRMAPPPGAPMVKTFVTAPPLHVRYNSRLPIVVYVPKGYEVRYRIWQAPETTEKAEKG
jgi:ecotin